MIDNDKKQDFEQVLDSLEKKGSSFAIATVIRTMSSTAAKPGMKAIISDKGEILSGWLGGGCVTNAVCNTAIETLNFKKPKLVVLTFPNGNIFLKIFTASKMSNLINLAIISSLEVPA